MGSERPDEPRLLVPREEARAKLLAQIGKADKLKSRSLDEPEDIKAAVGELNFWVGYNKNLLQKIFSNMPSFIGPNVFSPHTMSSVSWDDDRKAYNGIIRVMSSSLSSLVDWLDVLDEDVTVTRSVEAKPEGLPPQAGPPVTAVAANPPAAVAPAGPPPAGAGVFIVHGHDNEAKQSVARLVERLGLHAVILHEQSNQGLTIIEKFERHSNAAYAVVLLTPDDLGSSRADGAAGKPPSARARQNVVLELGYFLGKFGRARVCALVRGGVEIPSDLQGLMYETFDDGGAWEMRLAKAMKAAGLAVDLNKL